MHHAWLACAVHTGVVSQQCNSAASLCSLLSWIMVVCSQNAVNCLQCPRHSELCDAAWATTCCWADRWHTCLHTHLVAAAAAAGSAWRRF